MRYTTLQVCATFLALAATAGAQVPATAPPDDATSPQRSVRAAEAQRRALERTAQRLVLDSAALNRATLGVTLGQTGKRDTLGIFVSAVAENGPAERAGIYEGDRIAAINGVDVRTTRTDAEDSYLRGVAHRRLSLELRKLAPGQQVNLRVWSGGRYKDVQVTMARYAEVYPNRRFTINIGDGNFVLPMPQTGSPIQLTPQLHIAPPVLPYGNMYRRLSAPAPLTGELALPEFEADLDGYDLEGYNLDREDTFQASAAGIGDAAELAHEALRQAGETLHSLEVRGEHALGF